MTENQAERDGYVFTGIYERDKELVQSKKNGLKKLGYKSVVVTVPDSPLSRGFVGKGYSLYAEPLYLIDKDIKTYKNSLTNFEERKAAALERYNKEIDEIKGSKERFEKTLFDLVEKRKTILAEREGK